MLRLRLRLVLLMLLLMLLLAEFDSASDDAEELSIEVNVVLPVLSLIDDDSRKEEDDSSVAIEVDPEAVDMSVELEVAALVKLLVGCALDEELALDEICIEVDETLAIEDAPLEESLLVQVSWL